MPHLAPLKWLLLTILFWFIMLLSLTMTWWQSSPSMNYYSSSRVPISPTTWLWK